MYGGFDPQLSEAVFFERRRKLATAGALLVLLTMAWCGHRGGLEERAIEVRLEPEIHDIEIEEEPEEQIEEEPPPPPPPENTQVKRVSKPRPRPELAPPDKKVTEQAEESTHEKVVEVADGRASAQGTGTKPAKKLETKPPEPKPAPKAEARIDPKKPVDRPENATAPIPDPQNPPPDYPEALRDKGITGKVVMKLKINEDGSVGGAKILSVQSNAPTEDEQAEAKKLFLVALKIVQKWKYTPAKLNGQAITVWHTVTVPFTLSTG